MIELHIHAQNTNARANTDTHTMNDTLAHADEMGMKRKKNYFIKNWRWSVRLTEVETHSTSYNTLKVRVCVCVLCWLWWWWWFEKYRSSVTFIDVCIVFVFCVSHLCVFVAVVWPVRAAAVPISFCQVENVRYDEPTPLLILRPSSTLKHSIWFAMLASNDGIWIDRNSPPYQMNI